VPVDPNGPGTADPSQFWFVPGFYKYGEVFDANRNRDTLVAFESSTLDGGAGNDSLVGSSTPNSRGDNFFVSAGPGGILSQEIAFNDAVFGNGGNDTVTFTDSDYLWWSGHQEDDPLAMNGYTIAGDISNLVLQMGAPTARNGTGNRTSTGNGNQGSNLIVGNEFDNILDGNGVGGQAQTGTGIDTLTGDGGQSFVLGSDNFIVGSNYRNSSSNVWDVQIKTTDISTIDPITGAVTPRFQHEWNARQSRYLDFDFVIITDFDANDNLSLGGDASEYSIGNVSSDLSNPGGNVGHSGSAFTSNQFGIYYTGIYGSTNPNLVAIIQTADATLLDTTALVQRPSLASPQITGNALPPDPPFGWGNSFWELNSSSFNAYVNQTYFQQASTASLSDLINRIA
jgi:hypothetical protein